MKNFLMVIGIVIIVIAIPFGCSEFSSQTSSFFGHNAANMKINQSGNILAQEQWFFDQCAAINSFNGQIESQKSVLTQTTGDEHERVLTNISALQSMRVQDINDYNMAVQNKHLQGQFKSSTLPSYIDPTTQGNVTCQ